MKNKLRKTYRYIFGTIAILPVVAKATTNVNIGVEIKNPLKGTDNLLEVIAAILDFIVKVGTAIAVLFVVYAGYLFVSARGNEEKLTKAKSTLFWTVIGALILIGAFVLGEVICNTANQLGAGQDCSFFGNRGNI